MSGPGGVLLDSASLPPGSADKRSPGGSLAAEITTRIVELMRLHTGRGPTKAKTALSADLVVITLADCLTTAERRLASAGHAELIMRARSVIHQEMRAEATAIVEELTHRQVAAYLTDQEHHPDLTVIIFYLAPPASPAASATRGRGALASPHYYAARGSD